MDSSNPTTGEIIAFLAEHKPQIAPFRAEEVCSEEASNISKDACYIQKWLVTFLEAPHNCTYPYMHRLRKTNLKSCLPLTIMDNYESTVEATSYLTHTCILACDRWNTPIDVSYNDLQYELIEEVSTVSFAGLIAQIGGQMSLFMGSSILNLIQVVVMSIIYSGAPSAAKDLLV
uniref:Uncharacterized protein n=1 Tax=Ditylenchus dipsaci TaxID=166011 RepID=A0A915DEF0_9BILA